MHRVPLDCMSFTSHNTPSFVLIHVSVLPVHWSPPFLGEFQEENLPTKQILWQLWESSCLSFFLWFMFCLPAVDWSVYDSVSDWWSFTSKHLSSATPKLPACLETKTNRIEATILWLTHKLVVTWLKSLQGNSLTSGCSLNSTSPVTLFPADRVLPVYNHDLISIMLFNTTFLFYLQHVKKKGTIISLLLSTSCSLVFTQDAALSVQRGCFDNTSLCVNWKPKPPWQ